MGFFRYSRQATQEIRWADLFAATVVAHTVGVAIGCIATLTPLMIFSPDSYHHEMLLAVAISDAVMLPVTIFTARACARSGYIGIGTAWIVGAVLGFLAAAPWAYFEINFMISWTDGSRSPTFEEVFIRAWTGVPIGMIASTTFWFIMLGGQPGAFREDPLSQRPFAVLVYIPVVLAVPLFSVLPEISEEIRSVVQDRRDAQARNAIQAITLEDDWSQAAIEGQGAFIDHINKLKRQAQAAGDRKNGARSVAYLGRELLKWGEVEAARHAFVQSIDGGTPVNMPLVNLARVGDVSGLHLVCLRTSGPSQPPCFGRLSELLSNWQLVPDHSKDLPIASQRSETLKLWQDDRLGPALAAEAQVGAERLLLDQLEDIPQGLFRADALTDAAEELVATNRPDAAAAVFDLALGQCDCGAAQTDILLARMTVAWIAGNDRARAAANIQNINEPGLKDRLSLRLKGLGD